MLNIYDITFLKEQYSEYKLLYFEFKGNEFVFRNLKKDEFIKSQNIALDNLEYEDLICQLALVYPSDYIFSESRCAGISTQAHEHILKISGYSSDYAAFDLLDHYRNEINNNFEYQCESIIKCAFPEYSIEDIKAFTFDKLIEITARAEFILNLKGYNIKIVNKEEEIKELAEKENLSEFSKTLMLYMQGVDPMYLYSDQLEFKKDVITYPLIGSYYWNMEELSSGIRKQIKESKEYKFLRQ